MNNKRINKWNVLFAIVCSINCNQGIRYMYFYFSFKNNTDIFNMHIKYFIILLIKI